ncbi:hypothetical protein [Nonomuraea helvata]|uniref:Uncharacterized protein n=1 Tax=Nonomuraea helvata TaxID=37484 RepID=A0ABV5S5Z8_9ACTN
MSFAEWAALIAAIAAVVVAIPAIPDTPARPYWISGGAALLVLAVILGAVGSEIFSPKPPDRLATTSQGAGGDSVGSSPGSQRSSGATRSSPSTDDSGSVNPSPTEPGIRHEGSLLLVAGNAADLDVPSDNPRWEGSGYDIYLGRPGYNNEGMIEPNYGARWATSNDAADYNTCFHLQGYRTSSFEYTLLQRAKTLCMITNTGRIAAMSIQSAARDELRFNVKVYLRGNE